MCLSTKEPLQWLQDDLVALAVEIYQSEDCTIVEAVRRAQAALVDTLVYAAEWDQVVAPIELTAAA